jgi:glycosidase
MLNISIALPAIIFIMKKYRYHFLFLFFFCWIVSCKQKPAASNTNQSTGIASSANVDSGQRSPDWIMQGNIYEVNVRQYTPEGTFKAFQQHLDRLKEMGVQTLWFMPINPISKKDRKGPLGSYYAVADYTAVNPEFGTLDDWKDLVNAIHSKGMKVIIDWVPNHTGADNRWLTKHPEFYVKDSTGKFVSPFDWTDVKKLDYTNVTMQDSMINSMRYWIKESNIDGFRCDHAQGVSQDFWRRCNTSLKKEKPLLMLAEAEENWLSKVGFDMSYAWRFFHATVDIAAGKRPANTLDTIIRTLDTLLDGQNAPQLYFTSNHDENSWNKADYGTMPGAKHAPFAVLSQTMKRSVPLIYSGQEEPILRPIKFFERDPMKFGKYERAAFYQTLLTLRHNNEALAADASFQKIQVGDPKALYAFVREKGGKKVLVILNLSNKEQLITINDASLHGNPRNVFIGSNEPLNNKSRMIEKWGYVVYEYASNQ